MPGFACSYYITIKKKYVSLPYIKTKKIRPVKYIIPKNHSNIGDEDILREKRENNGFSNEIFSTIIRILTLLKESADRHLFCCINSSYLKGSGHIKSRVLASRLKNAVYWVNTWRLL